MQQMKYFGEGKRQLVFLLQICFSVSLLKLEQSKQPSRALYFPLRHHVALLLLLGKAPFHLNERIRFISHGMNSTEVILDKWTCNWRQRWATSQISNITGEHIRNVFCNISISKRIVNCTFWAISFLSDSFVLCNLEKLCIKQESITAMHCYQAKTSLNKVCTLFNHCVTVIEKLFINIKTVTLF